ncbi:MAG: peptide-methionine (R)-S-oxide reductase MsrB [Hyphomicrobiaceae bacterium]
MVNRRLFGIAGLGTLLAGWGLHRFGTTANAKQKADGKAQESGEFEIVRTASEWRQRLTRMEYYVLREHGTERPFSSPLDKNYSPGTYACAGCDLPLFSSEHKFDSRTGWPSFWQPLENAVGTTTDYWIGYPRTEVHCRRCGGHQGHVFKDGPKPTGLRYCINGVALKFVPQSKDLVGG